MRRLFAALTCLAAISCAGTNRERPMARCNDGTDSFEDSCANVCTLNGGVHTWYRDCTDPCDGLPQDDPCHDNPNDL